MDTFWKKDRASNCALPETGKILKGRRVFVQKVSKMTSQDRAQFKATHRTVKTLNW